MQGINYIGPLGNQQATTLAGSFNTCNGNYTTFDINIFYAYMYADMYIHIYIYCGHTRFYTYPYHPIINHIDSFYMFILFIIG